MAGTDSFSASFPPAWAFVVQLRRGSALTAERMEGRVEHVVSGQSAAFTSLEEMRAFMERIMAQAEDAGEPR
ncbi:MAG: hypothetical protein L0H73_12790 [Nitrococcus sp.]|nr:hypothetical protein [Nitrococcus sp.]